MQPEAPASLGPHLLSVGVIRPNERWFTRGLTSGSGSQVFVLNIGDRQSPFIVKLQVDDPTGSIEQEGWALIRARDTGAPVPEVVHSGSFQHDGKVVGVLVQTSLEGGSLADSMDTLSLGSRIEAFRQMGEALARVHQAQLGGFWKRHPTGGWDFSRWEDLMASTLRDRQVERKQLSGAGLSEDEARAVFAGIQRYAQEFPCYSPALCHGDYVPEHAFFDRSGQLSGIIDFSMYYGGDPISDLAITRMELEPWAFDQVVEGYSKSASLGDRFDLHLHLSLLTAQADYLFHHLTVQGHPKVDQYLQGLRSTLAWLEKNG